MDHGRMTVDKAGCIQWDMLHLHDIAPGIDDRNLSL